MWADAWIFFRAYATPGGAREGYGDIGLIKLQNLCRCPRELWSMRNSLLQSGLLTRAYSAVHHVRCYKACGSSMLLVCQRTRAVLCFKGLACSCRHNCRCGGDERQRQATLASHGGARIARGVWVPRESSVERFSTKSS